MAPGASVGGAKRMPETTGNSTRAGASGGTTRLALPGLLVAGLLVASVLIASLLAAQPAAALSNAARYLVDAEIAEACASGKGHFEQDGIREIDLDGDGRKDLMLDHNAIVCEGDLGRSLFCGAQVCSIKTFVREGALLQPSDEALGIITRFDPGPPPRFEIMGHGGQKSMWRPGRE